MATMNLWQRKLLALLHDPPEKAYDYSPKHEERAMSHARAFGLTADYTSKDSDWTSAAADRFIAPKGGPGTKLGEGVKFHHPLAGKECSLQAEDFPSQADAEKIISDSTPSFQGVQDGQMKFWHAWRLWVHYALTHKTGERHNADRIAYLPADTRTPDTSIWNHCAVASALESSRCPDRSLAPAFLLFQIGPVQDFISQAQSTRDLWSGSFLLSWLMAHAMKSCADTLGPDTIIFPSLRGQPLYDWLERHRLEAAKFTASDGTESRNFWADLNLSSNQSLPLTPGFPNRFLAVVPADFDVEKNVCAAFEAEWRAISKNCLSWLDSKKLPIGNEMRELWDFQISHHWQLFWQVLPWSNANAALEALAQIPGGKEGPLRQAETVAEALKNRDDKDKRCFRDDQLNTGWAWSAHYQLCQYHLDARRQTREFAAWQGREGGVKDAFSGKEEAVVFGDWFTTASASAEIGHLFRQPRPLGAPNLVKRIWHLAHLAAHHGFEKNEFSFPSVPAVAAAPWREKVLSALQRDTDPWVKFLAAQQTIKAAHELLDFELPAANNESGWLKKVDASVFHPSTWESMPESPERNAALLALRSLLQAIGSSPGKYYAVLALDGDQIGQWLSGEKTPKVRDLVTDATVAWFEANLPEQAPSWLDGNRPLSPGYHLQFSEALANFGLHCARRIVERHSGRLIYSGGDDVLAILPADEAIACATGLRKAFQGDPSLCSDYAEDFQPAPQGFVRLKTTHPSEPTWTLLVPGPKATVSVGIAIGHLKEPLQDMIREAQAAEKHAKSGLERDALSVRLYKRSGEQVHWGAKFASPAFPLWRYFAEHSRPPLDDPKREMPIHGKFPYRVCSMLSVYETMHHNEPTPLTPALQEIAQKEVAWIAGQNSQENDAYSRQEFLHLASAYLTDLVEKNRPLRDFSSLFAMEAFLARQGDDR
jgi:CRISPR-associated protein Cmr2